MSAQDPRKAPGTVGMVGEPLVSLAPAYPVLLDLPPKRKPTSLSLGLTSPSWPWWGQMWTYSANLSLNISVEDMERRWYRDQPTQTIHVHKKGEDMQKEQME